MLSIAVVSAAALAAVWIAYPLVLQVFAMLGRHPRRMADVDVTSVSVIIATRAGQAEIQRRVADAVRTDFPVDRLEIVVAIDASAVPEPARASDPPDAGVRWVAGDAPGGKAATLNAAVRAARGTILVFTDTAQEFDRDTISRLVTSLLADDRLGAVSGALHLEVGRDRSSAASLYWSYERRLRETEARVHSTVGVTGAVYAMWRTLWTPLPENLILDDLYVPMRLVLRGRRIGFDAVAIARDHRHFSPRQEYHRKLRTLTGVLQLCAWLPQVLAPHRNPIWLQFVFHKVLRLLTPYLAVLLACSLLWLIVTRVPWPVGYVVLAAVVLGTGVALLRSRQLREVLAGAILLQIAAAKALVNGLRRDWDVWRQ